MYVCMYVFMNECVIYVYTSVCMYLCMYVSMYMCTYVYTYYRISIRIICFISVLYINWLIIVTRVIKLLILQSV